MSESAVSNSPVARGILLEQSSDKLVLGLPGTDYRIHLAIKTPVEQEIGKRVSGRIYGSARRVDVCGTGGRLIEPVYGRPRRVQGRVIAVDAEANRITVFAACPITVDLLPTQSTGDFAEGMMVTFDVQSGTRFEPEG